MKQQKITFQQSNRVKTMQTHSRYASVKGETDIQYDKTTKLYVMSRLLGADKNGQQVRKFKRFSTLKKAKTGKVEFKGHKTLKQTPPTFEARTIEEYMEQYLERHKQEIEETISEYYQENDRRIKKYKLFTLSFFLAMAQKIIDLILYL